MRSVIKKQNRRNQLKNNSKLFLQLGIILALIIVYTVFEMKFTKNIFEIPINKTSNDEPISYVMPTFEIEKVKIPKKKIKQNQLPKPIDKIIIDDDNETNDYIYKLDPKVQIISLDSIIEITEPNEYPDEIVNFIIIEQAPIYPGCTGKNEEELKKCFNKKIAKFINKKFDTSLASELGLFGKQRILVLFEIDKKGNIINIQSKASHKRLEKEAIKITKKLPKMTPGKQRGRPVGVKYTLPIAFYIE
ncbi:MAG: energy transducer TonB [Bacteroidota bacterium]